MLIHVINGPHLRGAERFAIQLAEELSCRDIKQKIIILHHPENVPPDIVNCDYIISPSNYSRIAAWKWLRQCLVSEERHTIICHGLGTYKAVIASVAFSGNQRPFITVKQIGMIMPWLTRYIKIRQLYNMLLLRGANLFICLGPKQAFELHDDFKVPSEKISCIPNGRKRPYLAVLEKKSNEFEILVVGALSPEKNPQLALELAKEVRKEKPETILTFVGDGPMRSNLEYRAKRDFPLNSVRFEGQVSNVWPYYQRSSVLLLCSQTEGVPGVVIEASYAGLPTIAWNVGDIETVLEDGLNGRVTPFGESSSLLKALLSVALNEKLRQDMADNAIDTSTKFGIDKVADAYIEVLRL